MHYRPHLMAYALLIVLPATGRADVFRWDNDALIPGTERITPGPDVLLDHRNLEFAELSSWSPPEFLEPNLTGARFDFSNLSRATFSFTSLANANFASANLSGANFGFATLHGAILANAVVVDANFGSTTYQGFTKEQLYSTASYRAKDLHGIRLGFTRGPASWPGPPNDLTGWDFSEQNLTSASFAAATLADARFDYATLRRADLSGATITGTSFRGAVGFTKDQLYSTASYRSKDLRGIVLERQNLTNANFDGVDLREASFKSATLTGARMYGANVSHASFWNATAFGFTKEQLYQTTSYQSKELQGINMTSNNLSDWDFHGQDLTDATFYGATLSGADFAGAIVTGAYLGALGFSKEQLYSTASYQAKELPGFNVGPVFPTPNFPGTDCSGWDFRGQNLIGADFWGATLADADFSGADTRGALIDLAGAASRNAILPDGNIAGLELTAGETLLVRDDDFAFDPLPYWREPRNPISIRIRQRMTTAAGSALRLRFGADAWDSLISFEPAIPVQLGGALELAFADGVDTAAQTGRTLDLFDWTDVTPTGQFEIVSPYAWDVSKLYTTGEVTLLGVPEPAGSVAWLLGTAALVRRRGPSSRI